MPRRETRHYSIKIEYSVTDECFIASVPEIHYCSAHGATPDDALREVQLALEATLDARAAHKMPIPQPAVIR